jgi:hypothetical protein
MTTASHEFLTPNQLAQRSGIGARRIRLAIKRSELKASTFGGKWFRIRPADFQAWADATRVGGESKILERINEATAHAKRAKDCLIVADEAEKGGRDLLAAEQREKALVALKDLRGAHDRIRDTLCGPADA